jgi:predicted phosphodiesterase
MRVAVFSDVHGNLAALNAVLDDIAAQRPDHVICGGDLAFGGPDPEGSVARVRGLGIPCVRGNTDESVVDATERDSTVGWARARLSTASLDFLAGLPFDHRVDDLVVFHATPWSVSDMIPKDAGVAQMRRVLGEARAAAVVYGHIHLGWIGRVPDAGLVVNTGSVGFPFDGDPRASYAVLERLQSGWSAELRRVDYDIDRSAGSFPPDHPAPAAWARRMRTGRRG